MERILIVSATEKSGRMLARLLSECGMPAQPSFALHGAEARRRMAEAEFSMVFINTPLPDEFGAELSIHTASATSAGVLLLAKAEIADEVAAKVGQDGVLVLSRPLGRAQLSQGIQLARATHQRIGALLTENRRLQARLEELRLVSRAKCVLIECGMTEPEAHTYIEKRAMDTRQSKRDVARELLQLHENNEASGKE
jgi:response regulator NasT